MKLRNTVLAALCTVAATCAHAGGFVELPTSDPLRVGGSQNLNADQFYIAEGAILSTDQDGFNTYAPPANLQLLAEQSTVVELEGEEVGAFFDFVFRDSSDDRLVFGGRLVLETIDAEVNDIFRSGFAGSSAAVAWTFATDTDLRLYSAARTAVGIKQGVDVFDADVVDLRSDINVQEGNPSTGLFLVKTDALYYALADDVIRVRQGGEEGQPDVSFTFAGYMPTNTAPVPEPSTYLMLAAGLGIVAFGLRRRR
ncbi:MAG: PEP-CTERM sorting domain-containing protein [Betaproteobacteria bacterium]|nr:PEP-CTERM sorting domain-containing protein [Betaproteobacteria bacterium]